jgi:hypothetical protein
MRGIQRTQPVEASFLTTPLQYNGKIVGTWQRLLKKEGVIVKKKTLASFKKPTLKQST